MIVLAFDVGRKKTGVAIGNLLTGRARPLLTARGSDSARRLCIDNCIRDWRPKHLVVGLPRHMRGEEHAMTAFCRRFAADLQKRFQLPTTLADERLTTAAARAVPDKQPGEDRDNLAAAILLQDWLRAQAATTFSDSDSNSNADSAAAAQAAPLS